MKPRPTEMKKQEIRRITSSETLNMTLPSEIAVDGNPQITNLASRIGVTCTGRTESLTSSQSAQETRSTALACGSSTLFSSQYEQCFRMLSCHHRRLQVQYAVLLKSGTEKDKVIAGLRARISALEGELYLVQLAHSGDTSDSLGRSLNQFDIASARTCGCKTIN